MSVPWGLSIRCRRQLPHVRRSDRARARRLPGRPTSRRSSDSTRCHGIRSTCLAARTNGRSRHVVGVQARMPERRSLSEQGSRGTDVLRGAPALLRELQGCSRIGQWHRDCAWNCGRLHRGMQRHSRLLTRSRNGHDVSRCAPGVQASVRPAVGDLAPRGIARRAESGEVSPATRSPRPLDAVSREGRGNRQGDRAEASCK